MIMTDYCARCLLGKKLEAYPRDAAPEAIEAYRRRVTELIERNVSLSSPEMDYEIDRVHEALFGPRRNYGPIKRHFNALMLALEPELLADVDAAADPLERAVQYAMIGNFIDFAAMGSVDEGALRERLAKAAEVHVDAAALSQLRSAAGSARRLLFMTDNCGEIVADKVLMRTLARLNPAMQITAMVRGEAVVNDATLEDAEQVGLGDVAHRIVGSGVGIAGNPLPRLSPEARAAIDAADLLIAKGQANYEALNGMGLNMFYIFMCKCQLFMDRFQVPQFTGMLTREDF